jgi:hypothetical protein
MIKLLYVLICILLLTNISLSQDNVTIKRKINKGSIITGSCLFAMPWLLCVAVASQNSSSSSLIIPIVGPFITKGMESTTSIGGLLTSTGISTAEAIGITLVILGIIGKKDTHQEIIYPTINKDKYGLNLVLTY